MEIDQINSQKDCCHKEVMKIFSVSFPDWLKIPGFQISIVLCFLHQPLVQLFNKAFSSITKHFFSFTLESQQEDGAIWWNKQVITLLEIDT